MFNLPNLFRLYCILAILLLLGYGVVVLREVSAKRAQNLVLSAEIDEASRQDRDAHEKYLALEGKQRRERGGYSGEEAVLASVAVMDAKEDYEQLHQQLESLKEQQASLVARTAALQLRIVPIVAIALLHLFGFFMIRTERS